VLLVTCFAWWEIANNPTDLLVKVFQEIFGTSTFQAVLIQMAFCGGYCCMGPQGAVIAVDADLQSCWVRCRGLA
jgi:FHS family L-fucose permease-like MFS transporter